MIKIVFDSQKNLASQLVEVVKDTKDASLDISKNPLGKRPQEQLLSMINEIGKNDIQQVNMSCTGLHLKKTEELIELIVAFKSTAVTSLNLSTNGLGFKKTDGTLARTDDELERIMEAFKATQLKDINLSSNNLGNLNNKCLRRILSILNDNKQIAKVDLSFNQFDKVAGAPYMAQLFFETLGKKVVLHDEDSFTKIVKEKLGLFLATTAEYIDSNRRGFFNDASPEINESQQPKSGGINKTVSI